MAASNWSDNLDRLALKNLPEGTSEESLMKAMTELGISPSKIVVLNIDRNPKAHICFPDYQSCKFAFIVIQ